MSSVIMGFLWPAHLCAELSRQGCGVPCPQICRAVAEPCLGLFFGAMGEESGLKKLVHKLAPHRHEKEEVAVPQPQKAMVPDLNSNGSEPQRLTLDDGAGPHPRHKVTEGCAAESLWQWTLVRRLPSCTCRACAGHACAQVCAEQPAQWHRGADERSEAGAVCAGECTPNVDTI